VRISANISQKLTFFIGIFRDKATMNLLMAKQCFSLIGVALLLSAAAALEDNTPDLKREKCKNLLSLVVSNSI
jgi:hypothetical protein